jgi:hypothetical protein
MNIRKNESFKGERKTGEMRKGKYDAQIGIRDFETTSWKNLQHEFAKREEDNKDVGK